MVGTYITARREEHIFSSHSAGEKALQDSSRKQGIGATMSGGGGANYHIPATDDWPEAPRGFGIYAPALTLTRRSLSRGVALAPHSLSFHTNPSDSGRGGPPGASWATNERALAVPSGFVGSQNRQARVPQFTVREVVNPARAQVAVLEPPSPPRLAGQWALSVQARHGEDSRLTLDEQKSVLEKLKKKIYNPTPNRFVRRLSLYYRERARKGASEATRNVHEDEDGKRCPICLEDFKPKEEVMVTPCDHMFHEDCILPWVKSHGQCPVCRSVLCDQRGQNQSSFNNSSGSNARTLLGNDPFSEEIASMIRLMEDAI